jgi:uncharacterized protein
MHPKQMSLKLLELPVHGRQWEWNVPPAVMEDASVGSVDPVKGLRSDVHWQAQVVRSGDLYTLSGNWSSSIQRHCARCTAEFELPLQGESRRDYQVGTAHHVESEEESDSDIEILEPPGLIDLVDVLREDVWLAWRPVVVCSEACKGLCPRCGANLNEGECRCSGQDEDHPFAALKNLKLDG